MDIPTVKQIIDEIEAFINVEVIDFQFILKIYAEFIETLPSMDEFRSYAGDDYYFFVKKLEMIRLNAANKVAFADLHKEKTALWGLSAAANDNSKKVIRLLITGLVSKESLIDYSNYPEYLAGDMLELSVSVLHDVGWQYAENFSKFCRKYMLRS